MGDGVDEVLGGVDGPSRVSRGDRADGGAYAVIGDGFELIALVHEGDEVAAHAWLVVPIG